LNPARADPRKSGQGILLIVKQSAALVIAACGCLSMTCALGAALPEIPMWDAVAIPRVCTETLANARAHAARLEQSDASITAARLFKAWDDLQILLEDADGPIDLFANVAPDPATRAAAEACQLEFRAFYTELHQNTKIFRRMQAAEPGDAIDQKLKKDIVEAFEYTGAGLPEAKRARMQAILQRLEEISQAFNRNIRDNQAKVVFTAEELKGLPEAYISKARRDGDGKYLLGFAYPEYDPLMANAQDASARHRYYVAFNNRGSDRNLALLDEAGSLRLEIARLFEMPSYAHFVMRRRMVRTPGTVERFLDDVKTRVGPLERREVGELRAFKAERGGDAKTGSTFNRWDLAYYQEQYKKLRFNVDQEALRAYFPTDVAIDWALGLSSALYGIKFTVATVPVWDRDVRYYSVNDGETGVLLGGIYLDLFPRAGKYSHAAAFNVRSSSSLAKRTPISVLVTNFNRTGLTHGELVTLLHEFGHVLHGVLSRTRYASHGGTHVERDFVEAPSQMYEEWAHAIEPLRLIQNYCGDCPAVDAALVERLNAARAYGQGIRYARQHLYASFDLAITGVRQADAMATWIPMENESAVGYAQGTQFPGTFTHVISGYSAGYYGYMWSKALALDMVSTYGDNLMNAAAGRRFRSLILEQGGQKPAEEMVRDFLGRAPSRDAFFDEITGQRKR
jgi:thimet oligopeptidase